VIVEVAVPPGVTDVGETVPAEALKLAFTVALTTVISVIVPAVPVTVTE
jgi:hypothetical protein